MMRPRSSSRWLVTSFLFAVTAHAAEQPLSLGDAVARATRDAGAVQMAGARADQSADRTAQARAALLPSLTGSASVGERTFNLRAQGFPLPPTTPDVIGPIDNVDARIRIVQPVVDVAAWQRWRAAGVGAQASRAELTATTEAAAQAAALAWLRAARTTALVEARRQDLALALELQRLAREQHAAGVSPAIDTTRASSQAVASRAALLVAENQRDRARLDLARTLGVDATVRFVPSDTLSEALAHTRAPLEREAALTLAHTQRPELEGERARLDRAMRERSATALERLPRVDAAADWGLSGRHTDDWKHTRSLALGLTWPLFDGLRREARLAEQGASVREATVRTRDLEEQVRAEVEAALLDLDSGREQVVVALDRLRLADEEVAQAAERFRNGVAGNIEVINAQLSLLRARDAEIDARFAVAAARVALARATGVAREIQ